MVFFWHRQQCYQKTEIFAMVSLADIAVVSKNRNLDNGFFLADIAVVSKNRNFGNGFFWQTQQWYQKTETWAMGFFWQTQQWDQKTEILAMFYFFCRNSSGINKPKFWQYFFFPYIAVVSKNRNFGNVFFWQLQQWYQKIELLAMDVFGRHSSGIKKSKFCQWFLF